MEKQPEKSMRKQQYQISNIKYQTSIGNNGSSPIKFSNPSTYNVKVLWYSWKSIA